MIVKEFTGKDANGNDIQYLSVVTNENGVLHRNTIPKQYATQEMLDALQSQAE